MSILLEAVRQVIVPASRSESVCGHWQANIDALQPYTALIGKEIGVVRLCLAEDPDDLVQDRFRSRPHIQRPSGEP